MDIGDVVVLRAGSPMMTIERIGKVVFGRQPVRCVWFTKTRDARATFDAKILKSVDVDRPEGAAQKMSRLN